MTKLSTARKALVAIVPLVTTLVVHFAGADSDLAFIVTAVVSALTVAGVYVVPNTATS